jgi:dTDP-4-dehydrorhamnose reductase
MAGDRVPERDMKILVTGSDGLVGTSILPQLAEELDVIPYVESQWDITSAEQSEAVIGEIRPDVFLNLAAVTDVDGCEDRPELAYRVNGDAPGLLAEICRRHGTQLISFSTDYVFDGKKDSPWQETDPPDPVSVYGKSKRLGEEKALAADPRTLIIRTEWIYGDKGESFITKVLRRARETGRVEVVDDQAGTPTYAKDLARPIMALIKNNAYGIYHVTNDGSCTWYRFALYLFERFAMNVTCAPIKTVESNRKAVRPSYSVLDCSKLRSTTGITMRKWQDAVDEYIGRIATLQQ